MRAVTILACALLAACSNEAGVVIEAPDDRDDDEFLTVMERFETAYVGNWQEDGNCAGGQNVLSLRDERVRFGDTSCDIDAISKGTARVRLKLKQCEIEGTATADRTYILDIAGTEILYVTGTTLPRTRLERCAEI